MKVQLFLWNIATLSVVTLFKITFFDCLNCWNFFPSKLEETFINTRKGKFSLHHWQDFPSRSMATLRNKIKLAALSRETPEGSRSRRGQNVLDPELTQDYVSQVSEEIEGRVTKKLSKEFSKTESRILGALSKLDEFLRNPQVRTCSVAVQGTSRNVNSENREIHGDRSSNDPYPEVGYFPHHSGRLNSPEAETNSHMVTINYPHMATGVPEEIRHNPHMMTATQDEITYYSSTTSSGKEKKARSTRQPQFRSDVTSATIEADQILLALQKLAMNSNSANFNNNNSRISKLPNSLTTTMPTFDGNSKKFELFEDLFQTSLKIHNQLTEEDKINNFHSLMCVMLYSLSKTSLAPTEGIWEKSWLCSVKTRWNPSQWLRQNTSFNDWSLTPQTRSYSIFYMMNSNNWQKTHSELQLKRSSSNSSMPKCLLTRRNQLTRRIWKMARMNRLCRILKGS